MAMRITTKMMQGNSLSNLNTNKSLQDRLTTQLSTLKKIVRPSDDPVIAIRSLRLNCSLTKTEQFYEKNSKDAKAWLKLTDDSIDSVSEILTSMRTYVEQGVNSEYDVTDRTAIASNLRSLANEIYSIGNADYEGRSIFTGYRTGRPLTFQKDAKCKYSITQQLNNNSVSTTTFVRTGDLSTINEGNYNSKETTEYDVGTYEITRFRLAYSSIDEVEDVTKLSNCIQVENYLKQSTDVNSAQEIEIGGQKFKFVSDGDGETALYMNGKSVKITNGVCSPNTLGNAKITNNLKENGVGMITITDSSTSDSIQVAYTVTDTGKITFDDAYYSNYINGAGGTKTSLQVTKSFKENTDEAYMSAVGDANKDQIVYIASTGELLLGSNIASEIAKLDEKNEIRVTYDRSNWLEGDIDPVHYFYCEGGDEKTFYNSTKLLDKESDLSVQVITYDVGNNQNLQVNTTADEVFNHDIGRDVDEILSLLDQIGELQDTLDKVKSMLESNGHTEDEIKKLTDQKAALEKSLTYTKDKAQKMCENDLTRFTNYLSDTSLALTKIGSRESRQQLVDNRLSVQKSTFEELVSENEDADLTDLAVQLSSVELTYEAALSSISYVMKTSLLNFL